MTTPVVVPMDDKLLDEMKQVTTELGVSLEDVFNDLARKYLREARRQKIDTEFSHYQAMHAQLKDQYYGQHVAIHNGELIDHDADYWQLVRRVRQRFGRIPILFTLVGDQAIPDYTTHSGCGRGDPAPKEDR